MKYCGQCGFGQEEGGFCGECGNEIGSLEAESGTKSGRECDACGTVMKDEAIYCFDCGERVKPESVIGEVNAGEKIKKGASTAKSVSGRFAEEISEDEYIKSNFVLIGGIFGVVGLGIGVSGSIMSLGNSGGVSFPAMSTVLVALGAFLSLHVSEEMIQREIENEDIYMTVSTGCFVGYLLALIISGIITFVSGQYGAGPGGLSGIGIILISVTGVVLTSFLTAHLNISNSIE